MSGPGRPQLHPEEIWDVTSVKLSRVNKQFVKANELNLTEFINCKMLLWSLFSI